MVVLVENIRGTVARLDWGDGQTKIDVPTDIFFQWRASPPQISHSAGCGTYQASVATVTF